MSRALNLVRANWYIPTFIAMVAGVWWLARLPDFMRSGGELSLLIDLCATAPVLYMLCYARKQAVLTTAVRAFAIACGGLWLAAWLIPPSEQILLPQLAPLRWFGLVIVGVVEVHLLVATVRIVFSGRGTAEEIARTTGAPPLIAKLMMWEARFWRGAWQFLRKKSDGD